jgi:hypothetical protein
MSTYFMHHLGKMHKMSAYREVFFVFLPARVFCFQNFSKGFNGGSRNLSLKVSDFNSVRFGPI